MLLKFSITMVFTNALLSTCTMSSLFRENNNVVVLPFPFPIFMLLENLWFIPSKESTLKTRRITDLYPSRLLAFGRGRSFIPGFSQSPPTLTVILDVGPNNLRICESSTESPGSISYGISYSHKIYRHYDQCIDRYIDRYISIVHRVYSTLLRVQAL